jgi:hypothetical protein
MGLDTETLQRRGCGKSAHSSPNDGY